MLQLARSRLIIQLIPNIDSTSYFVFLVSKSIMIPSPNSRHLPNQDVSQKTGLPRLPHLVSHGDQPVEQLIPHRDRREMMFLPILRPDHQTIHNLTPHCPADNDLTLPPKTTHLLQFLDIANRNSPS